MEGKTLSDLFGSVVPELRRLTSVFPAEEDFTPDGLLSVCTLLLLSFLKLAMPASALLLGVETDSRLLGPWRCGPTGLRDNCAAGLLTPSSTLPCNAVPDDGTDDKFEEEFDIDGELDSLKDMFEEVCRGNFVRCVVVFGEDLMDEAGEDFADEEGEDLIEAVGDTLGDDLGEILVKALVVLDVFVSGVVFDCFGVVAVEEDLVTFKCFFLSVSCTDDDLLVCVISSLDPPLALLSAIIMLGDCI